MDGCPDGGFCRLMSANDSTDFREGKMEILLVEQVHSNLHKLSRIYSTTLSFTHFFPQNDNFFKAYSVIYVIFDRRPIIY
jgi:hypothetical protein